MKLTDVEYDIAIKDFQEMLRFKTVSNTAAYDGSYNLCADWILERLLEIEIDAFMLPESQLDKKIVVGTWLGSDPTLPGILLNSHFDVVPVIENEWNVPAFEGLIQDGKIYGRGAQDMKCVCVQYFVALRKLRKTGYQPLRNIYISYVPDEEVGGSGMSTLIQSTWFNSINIGIALDEGLASEDNIFSVFYGERLPWWIRIQATGNTGHASRFIEDTAAEKIINVANRALLFRKEQLNLLHGNDIAGCSHTVAIKKRSTLGDVTSLNITNIRSGIVAGGLDVLNVIPPVAELKLDIRISPHVDPSTVATMLDVWCEECTINKHDKSISWSYANSALQQHSTTLIDGSNPWWTRFESILKDKCGADIRPQVFPAATDSRFLRALGIKAFGFSPIRNSEIMLHEHNEYISKDIFLEGCEIYIDLLSDLCNTP